MKRLHVFALLLATLFLAAFAAGCGGDDESATGGTGAGAGAEETGVTEGAKVIDPAEMENASGNITVCTGKDTAGEKEKGIKDFEKANPDIKVKLLEFPESADEQRNQFVQRQQAESDDCDVFVSDVIWTAEFAGQKWLYDLSPYVEEQADKFIESTLATAQFDGKYWGVPRSTNAGFLYYRDNQVDQVPDTWQGVYDSAAQNDGMAYQGFAYEGLTVNFLEVAFAAGGEVINEDGTQAQFDSPENLEALKFMVEGIESGAVKKAVTTYMEEETRRAFEAGRVTYMRNWPYAYGLGNAEDSKIKGKFKVAPLPSFEGGDSASVLGGDNLVISAFSKNPGAALKLIDAWTSEETQKDYAVNYSLAPVVRSVYDDPEVQEAQPFAQELLRAVEQGRARPVSPVYPQISQAIYKNVADALSKKMTPEEALKKANDEIQQALETF